MDKLAPVRKFFVWIFSSVKLNPYVLKASFNRLFAKHLFEYFLAGQNLLSCIRLGLKSLCWKTIISFRRGSQTYSLESSYRICLRSIYIGFPFLKAIDLELSTGIVRKQHESFEMIIATLRNSHLMGYYKHVEVFHLHLFTDHALYSMAISPIVCFFGWKIRQKCNSDIPLK